jgi:hypothetical protein
MRRPSRNATPARGPADPISPAPRPLPLLCSPPGGPSSSGPGGIGRVGFWAEDDGLLALAVLGRGRGAGELEAAEQWGIRGVPIRSSLPLSSLFFLPLLVSVTSGFFLSFQLRYIRVRILITAVNCWNGLFGLTANGLPSNYQQRRHALPSTLSTAVMAC